MAPEKARYHQALWDIIATVDDVKGTDGHWHWVCLKIARAALHGHEADLSDEDWAHIARYPRSSAAQKLPPNAQDGRERNGTG